MIPNSHIQQYLAKQHQQELLREAENERLLANVPGYSSNPMRKIAGTLGKVLIVLGSHLQRLEQVNQPVVSTEQF